MNDCLTDLIFVTFQILIASNTLRAFWMCEPYSRLLLVSVLNKLLLLCKGSAVGQWVGAVFCTPVSPSIGQLFVCLLEIKPLFFNLIFREYVSPIQFLVVDSFCCLHQITQHLQNIIDKQSRLVFQIL